MKITRDIGASDGYRARAGLGAAKLPCYSCVEVSVRQYGAADRHVAAERGITTELVMWVYGLSIPSR